MTVSASEVEYQLLLACDLNYIQDETYRELRNGDETTFPSRRIDLRSGKGGLNL